MVAARPRQSAKTPEVSVLVLHSERRVRHLIAESAPQDHFAVSFAEGADQFERYLEETGAFDAILIGLTEPVETDLDLIHQVKSHCPNALVVFLCSAADKHWSLEALRRGAYDILAQPVDRVELKRILFNILERARHQ